MIFDRFLTTPSVSRNPATSSRSRPGVRMVTATDFPLMRISSGSSRASVSFAEETRPSIRRKIRRMAVSLPAFTILLYVMRFPNESPRDSDPFPLPNALLTNYDGML